MVDIQFVVHDLDGNGTKWSETERLNWYLKQLLLIFHAVRLRFSINVTNELCFWAECNFHLLFAVVLQESLQTDLNNQLNGIFSEIGNSNGLSFNILYAQVDRDRVDESFANCELLQHIFQRVFDEYLMWKTRDLKCFFIVSYSVCSILSSGVVIVFDITWDPVWPELTNFLRSSSVPYVHVDLTIRPFARAFFKYVQYTDTHDVAMIFQNEKGEMRKIHSF